MDSDYRPLNAMVATKFANARAPAPTVTAKYDFRNMTEEHRALFNTRVAESLDGAVPLLTQGPDAPQHNLHEIWSAIVLVMAVATLAARKS